MTKKRYVVTSGRRINLVLHAGDSFTYQNALKKAKKLKKKGLNHVCIKSYRRGEALSHIRCIL